MLNGWKEPIYLSSEKEELPHFAKTAWSKNDLASFGTVHTLPEQKPTAFTALTAYSMKALGKE